MSRTDFSKSRTYWLSRTCFDHENFCRERPTPTYFHEACSNPNIRTPNRHDMDYFDEYENPSLEEIPFYQQLLTRLYRCLYFLSGPKFLVPFTGKCSNINHDFLLGYYYNKNYAPGATSLYTFTPSNIDRHFDDDFHSCTEIQNLPRWFELVHIQELVIPFNRFMWFKKIYFLSITLYL